ncbi:GNAT family N-acetyltransferase [Mesobacillus zeae]|uniref:GNAT family N-acetyltransferase n=1 Tax=Mesobacillus zeae TaxID=1917180 RepID=A0A398B6L9_9BACI|nr:GNAT family N-acetyltransferase [Mesobacillus zeae]RID85749.1 GNAT family N-acetyltransferase [Mesobacillus zeae]
MNDLEKIVELDCEYIESFSKAERRDWGILFHNEDQPVYYDANHAHIWKEVRTPLNVLQDIKSFYEEKALTPRIYLYNLEKNKQFLEELKSCGFKYEEFEHPVQLWDGTLPNRLVDSDIKIELVTNENYIEALEIECCIQELGGRTVREKSFPHEFAHPQFTYYLLRYKGIACCTACLFKSDKQARIESVATLEAYRGKGLIGHLIRYIQEIALENNIEKLWIFPINESVERVYHKSGFKTVSTIRSLHAFTCGKSIKEIQG